jgi:hypothetical protein
MIGRRDMLKLGAATPLALGFPAALNAATARIDLWVSDARFARPAPPVVLPRTVTLADGDVTPLWTGTLDDAWRRPGFVVAGTSGSDTLFVLEQLAWSRGRRVVERREIMPRGAGRPALVRWLIAPVHPSAKA